MSVAWGGSGAENAMKTIAVVAIVVIIAGAYMEYEKDSSLASVDTGSLLMGAGVGILIGCYT
jgi:hypothetical protein